MTTSLASRQWALAMLTTAVDHDPRIFELAAETTPEGATYLAGLAAAWAREVAQANDTCANVLLAEMGLEIAREAG
jgi:NAD dependent epimerase/dehydratase family enzyme